MPKTDSPDLELDLKIAIDDPRVRRNSSPAALYEDAIRRGEASLAEGGALVASTGEHTGRSPKDRFLARHGTSTEDIDWGPVNQPIDPAAIDHLLRRSQRFLDEKPFYVFDGFAGAHPDHRLKVRIVSEYAWHSLFSRNMFIRPSQQDLQGFAPDFTVIDLPSVVGEPATDGLVSKTYILLDLARSLCLIGGTEYAGEIKKSIFGVLNYHLPRRGVLSMHCSANYGASRDDVALFFGLSGTGKTTLSADPTRTLIGDDEHGWGDDGIFNFEGGCYAKVIRLDPNNEPDIYQTTRRFGTILENVVCDEKSREPDLDDDSLTENTRASYPLSHLENVDLGGVAGHPRVIVFLTCDAFGVLPPVSRLDESQAMYHFLSGYTAKVAGTERGVTEPSATFSACFGAPFMPLAPAVYAEMLGERIRRHRSQVYLVNTGWTGGPYGTGERISLKATRRIVSAALSGELAQVPTQRDPLFGLEVPQSIEGVDARLLDPRQTWSRGSDYDATALKLAKMFRDNFETFAAGVSEEVRAAAPRT